MPSTINLSVLQVRTPCPEDWDAMARDPSDPARRFCDRCQLHVQDLTTMAPVDAQSLLTASAGRRLCARLPAPAPQRATHRFHRAARALHATLLALVVLALFVTTLLGGGGQAPPNSRLHRVYAEAKARLASWWSPQLAPPIVGDIAIPMGTISVPPPPPPAPATP